MSETAFKPHENAQDEDDDKAEKIPVKHKRKPVNLIPSDFDTFKIEEEIRARPPFHQMAGLIQTYADQSNYMDKKKRDNYLRFETATTKRRYEKKYPKTTL